MKENFYYSSHYCLPGKLHLRCLAGVRHLATRKCRTHVLRSRNGSAGRRHMRAGLAWQPSRGHVIQRRPRTYHNRIGKVVTSGGARRRTFIFRSSNFCADGCHAASRQVCKSCQAGLHAGIRASAIVTRCIKCETMAPVYAPDKSKPPTGQHANASLLKTGTTQIQVPMLCMGTRPV